MRLENTLSLPREGGGEGRLAWLFRGGRVGNGVLFVGFDGEGVGEDILWSLLFASAKLKGVVLGSRSESGEGVGLGRRGEEERGEGTWGV
jgi:hypothetical protein